MTGYFHYQADFGGINLNSSEYVDIFIAKLDGDGNWLWANQAGGSIWDSGTGVAADSFGNCYLSAYFDGTLSIGNTTLTSRGGYDSFVAKLDGNGNWVWAAQAGGTNSDVINEIVTDDDGNCYAVGYFSSTTIFGDSSVTSVGENDIFVSKVDAGGTWQWVNKAGGLANDTGFGIAIDNIGNCYVTGYVEGAPSFGNIVLVVDSIWDMYVAKYGETSSSVEDSIPLPGNFALKTSYPNPFNAQTTIVYEIRDPAPIRIDIYNVKGQWVRTLVDDYKSMGRHAVQWDGLDCNNEFVANGIYYYTLSSHKTRYARKMIVMK